MKVISHRGNINGPDPKRENKIESIQEVLKKGYDCEIDVWFINQYFFLGHDAPTDPIDLRFLQDDRLWCHAKNIDSLEAMLVNNVHCFWHQEDWVTLTSQGFMWTYPGYKLTTKSIVVMPEWTNNDANSIAYGVCTDWISKWEAGVL